MNKSKTCSNPIAYEVCRLICTLYSNTVLLGLPPLTHFHSKLISRLKLTLRVAELMDHRAYDSRLLTWSLFVGGTASYRTPYRHNFQKTMREILQKDQSRTWVSVRETLCDFFGRILLVSTELPSCGILVGSKRAPCRRKVPFTIAMPCIIACLVLPTVLYQRINILDLTGQAYRNNRRSCPRRSDSTVEASREPSTNVRIGQRQSNSDLVESSHPVASPALVLPITMSLSVRCTS